MAILTTSADTSSVGNIWYNPAIGRIQYSYLSGGTIVVATTKPFFT